MRMDTAFPSKYIKASDLQGRPVTVTMSHVEMEQVGRTGDKQPVLYFTGKQKGLVLNKTNNNKICAEYGDDSDDWTGQPITLVERMVDYQGEEVPAIRIQIPPKSRARSDHQAPPRDHMEAAERDMSAVDDVPRTPALKRAHVDNSDIPF